MDILAVGTQTPLKPLSGNPLHQAKVELTHPHTQSAHDFLLVSEQEHQFQRSKFLPQACDTSMVQLLAVSPTSSNFCLCLSLRIFVVLTQHPLPRAVVRVSPSVSRCDDPTHCFFVQPMKAQARYQRKQTTITATTVFESFVEVQQDERKTQDAVAV